MSVLAGIFLVLVVLCWGFAVCMAGISLLTVAAPCAACILGERDFCLFKDAGKMALTGVICGLMGAVPAGLLMLVMAK